MFSTLTNVNHNFETLDLILKVIVENLYKDKNQE